MRLRPGVRRRALAGIATVLLAATACAVPDDQSAPVGALTASPVPDAVDTAAPSPPAPSPTASVSPTPAASPLATGPREPTDTDAARFIAGFAPEGATDLEHVAVDLDRRPGLEIVFTYVRTDVRLSTVEVAWWNGTAYEVRYSDEGGPADQVDRLRVADINGDGAREVIVQQSTGSSGGSLSAWQYAGAERLRRLIAEGGCDDGKHTYGVVGATTEDVDRDGREEITATCDDSPLPVSLWGSDTYAWNGGAYALRVVEPEPERDVSPEPDPSDNPEGERDVEP